MVDHKMRLHSVKTVINQFKNIKIVSLISMPSPNPFKINIISAENF